VSTISSCFASKACVHDQTTNCAGKNRASFAFDEKLSPKAAFVRFCLLIYYQPLRKTCLIFA